MIPSLCSLPILAYATCDGHSRRIAERLAARLAGHGLAVEPRNLDTDAPTDGELTAAGMLIVVAAVRFGRHLDAADRLVRRYARLPTPPPLALASVSLTARKPDKRTVLTNPYLRKWVARRRLQPVLAAAFAGRLDYPDYKWWERQAIRLIMTMTGGITDPAARVEFTDWAAVDAFADRIAAVAGTFS